MQLIQYIFVGWLISFHSYAASHHPQDFLNSIKGSKNEGELIVQHFCVNCHGVKPLIPIGAPRIGQKEDWAPRMNIGITALLKHTTEGLNAMPPRGGCFECTDEQLILAIVSMLPKELKNSFLNDLKDYKKNN
ncbi:c-type cytochrome [Legionella cardiaca]|uniref:C-type cytochrome n=1 Tax=Legionella cardiaca TaxID=1071983 RepID=A0ABY8AXQ4_9GAMM|nr:c-type cytochrome [Legionella cardiaca]WED44529.1 c-type cytochrome [Legionella cardiaca]